MWLLTASIVIFFIVVSMIIYANWPKPAIKACGSCAGSGCQQCPCNKCGMPRRRCGCGPPPGGCPFC
jgi:hypothetical protein